MVLLQCCLSFIILIFSLNCCMANSTSRHLAKVNSSESDHSEVDLESRYGKARCSLSEEEIRIYLFDLGPEENEKYKKQKVDLNVKCCIGRTFLGKCADWDNKANSLILSKVTQLITILSLALFLNLFITTILSQ